MRHSKLVLSGLLLVAVGMAWAAIATPPLWRDVKAAAIPLAGPRLITPIAARTVAMDYNALRAALAKAPSEGAKNAVPATLIDLPMPDGTTTTFRMVETAVMAPGLAAKYPGIKTYAGTAINDPLTQGRFDVGPRGLHGSHSVFVCVAIAVIDEIVGNAAARIREVCVNLVHPLSKSCVCGCHRLIPFVF